MPRYVPERGDLVWLNFTPQAGHEQAGQRPAFVVSPSAYNKKVGLGLMCPVTSRIKGYPFEVPLPEDGRIKGVILSDQIRSLDWRARKARFVVRMPEVLTAEVLKRVLVLLQF